MIDLAARFEVVARRRPVHLVVPGSGPLAGAVAPFVAVRAPWSGARPAELVLGSDGCTLRAGFTRDGVALYVGVAGRTSTHRSRRHGRVSPDVEEVALTLTGPQLTALTCERGAWVVRARFDLTERADAPDPHDPRWLAGLRADADGGPGEPESGRFGQLGLRDLRLVTNADGTAYRPPGEPGVVLLSATSAGPGWFPTGHASVWALDVVTLDLHHRADLFLLRDGRVFGDHAVHLVRRDDPTGGRWLLAASTWGDFHPQRRPVSVVLAESGDDLTRGVHVLPARRLRLPTDGLRSVGVWDPHLVQDADRWLVGYVSASRYFRFHPVLATGPSPDHLTLRAADTRRRECEGTTVMSTQAGWRVLASDRRRRRYPVLDLDLRELDTLTAHYPTNIAWPTVVDTADLGGAGPLLVGFDGQRLGGPLAGYGTHGQVVVQRAVPA